ncbi:MAG: hypothetical protein IJU82_00330 [Ruminiclostridium sp.]|nr:hypothetical protein [Ruminiclostridium sp.]
MEYKEFFEKAFGEAEKRCPSSDSYTAFYNVIERARDMKNENNEHKGLVEITPEYIEPKRSAKVLHAVAGVAGAAAVLTGAVFGLKFLAENGGLKEGGSDEIRAGYHGEVTSEYDEPLPAVPEKMSEEENVFDFGDLKVTVDWWQFDGTKADIQYTVEFDGEPRSAYEHDDVFSRVSVLIQNTPSYDNGKDTVFSTEGSVQKRRYSVTFDEPTDNFAVKFDDWDDGWARQVGDKPRDDPYPPDHYKRLNIYLNNGRKLAVHYTYSKDTDAFDDMEAYGCHRGKTYITHDAVSFEFSDITDVSVFDGMKLVIVDFDKNETPLGEGVLTLDESGTSGLLKFPTNSIDFDIGDIYAYRLQRPDETSAASEAAIMATWDRGESKNILDAEGDVLDFGDMTATIIKTDYDGHFIRVIYKADYHGGLSNDADWWFYQEHRKLRLYSYRNPAKNHFEGSWDTLPELGDDCFILATEITLDEGESIDNLWFEYMPEGAKLTEECVHIGSYIVNGVDHEKYDRSITIRDRESDIGVINLSPNGMIIISNSDFLYDFVKKQDCLLKYKDGTTEAFESTHFSSIYYEALGEEDIDRMLAEHGLTRDELVSRVPDKDEKNAWTKLAWFKPEQIDVDNVAAVILNGEEISFDEQPAETEEAGSTEQLSEIPIG